MACTKYKLPVNVGEIEGVRLLTNQIYKKATIERNLCCDFSNFGL